MSVEIGKIIQVYEQCIAILQARGEFFASETSPISSPREPKVRVSQSIYQACPQLILSSLGGVLKMWNKKLNMFKDFQINNQNCIKHLENKRNGLRNNTTLLSKEQQLISEAQSLIKEWSEIKDPIVFYDIKKRNAIRQELQTKVTEIKTNAAKTKQSLAPMYLRKIQEEFKTTLYEVYLDSAKIERVAQDTALNIWQNSLQKIYKQGNQLNKINLVKFISTEKSEFCRKYYQLLSKKQKISNQKFVEYYKSINTSVKEICSFWINYIKGLSELSFLIRDNLLILNKSKELLEKKQSNVVKYLEKTSQTVSLIFNIDGIIAFLVCKNQIFNITPLLSKFLTWVSNTKASVEANLRICQQYLNKIPTQIANREKQFHLFCIEDKNFLQNQSKIENSMDKKVIQGYFDFLNGCYNICKQNTKGLNKQPVQFYENHQIGGMLTRQIITTEDSDFKNKNLAKSQFSVESTTFQSKNGNKNEKLEKLAQIQKFIQKLQVFSSESINWNDSGIYSCALGPKLLLHGKLAILSQGVYFESFFNKRNLFFGRTRIFVPKSQILQTGVTNTLVIFPDAVELRTQVGTLYFHALGSRAQINAYLNETYFPQNSPNGQENIEQVQFKEYDEKQAQLYTPAQINQLLKPNQVHLAEKVFKNINLGKLFRRYFSDDKFQIRGQTYDNFKSYFMLQIEASDPKSTPITPQPPTYFMYKNEGGNQKNYPKISQRYHTYKKSVPKIPFISSGGDGLCEDKQTYHWISNKIFTIEVVSKVNGFSLTEGMQIISKTICKEQNSNQVRVNFSTCIKFAKESGTNNLVKGPALSSLKQSIIKMIDIIEKYEKGKKGKTGKSADPKNAQGNQQLQQAIEKLTSENKKLKKIIQSGVVIFIVLYVMTLLIICSFT